MLVVTFPVKIVYIAGQDWSVEGNTDPGSLSIHRKGTSLFMRLLGFSPKQIGAEGSDAMVVDTAYYPPVFNLQQEVVAFKYTISSDATKVLVLNIVTTRASKDIKQFYNGSGPATFTCMIAVHKLSAAYKSDYETVVKLIASCLPIKSSQMIQKSMGAEVIEEIVASNKATTFFFTLPASRSGSAGRWKLTELQADLRVSAPITEGMMNLILQLLMAEAPEESKAKSYLWHANMASQLIRKEDPKTISVALIAATSPMDEDILWHIMPVHVRGHWSLLVLYNPTGFAGPGRHTDLQTYLVDIEPDVQGVGANQVNDMVRRYMDVVGDENSGDPAAVKAIKPTSSPPKWNDIMCGDSVIHSFAMIMSNLSAFVKIAQNPTNKRVKPLFQYSDILKVRRLISIKLIKYVTSHE